MGKVFAHPKGGDRQAIWPGVVSTNRAGAMIAFETLCELEDNEPDGDGVAPTDRANVENWPREGEPFRNIVLEYLSRAKEGGLEAEAGFCAVLSDLVAQVSAGTVPNASFYEMLYNL